VPDQGRQGKTDYDLGARALLKAIEHYRGEGMRPDVLSAYWDAGRFRFVLVVDNQDHVDWRFRMDMSLGEYEEESAGQKKQGLFPLAITSYGDEADVQYAAIWVRYQIPG
jgi:hypothetical protein